MSRPIVVIATIGITIGIAVMIISLAVVTGFQQEIKNKMIGFGAHVQINNISLTNNRETSRVNIDQAFYPELNDKPGIKHIQIYATKAGVIETDEEIQGVVLKGVGSDMDWDFFNKHMVEGTVLSLSDTSVSKGILISKFIADRLKLSVNEDITVYLFKGRDDIRPRKFTIKGIYETGLEQFDKEFVITDIHHIRRINSWGLNAEIYVDNTCSEDGIELTGLAFGGDGIFDLEWVRMDAQGKGPHKICITEDRTIELVVHDRSATYPDTAKIELKPSTNTDDCACGAALAVTEVNSGDSYDQYVGGFELMLDDDQLDAVLQNTPEARERLFDLVEGAEMPVDLYITTIREQYPELFAWLELLDTNVVVIIVLMVVVAIINMTSALLITILERTNMIGILKAMGSSNASIRKIFLYNSAFTIFKGVFLGTVIGLLLCYLQMQFNIITLPQEHYYVSVVPILIKWQHILILNVCTLLVCVAALILPSLLVTRITPVRAIRFD